MNASRTVRAELLIGRRVYAGNNVSIGRLEEIRLARHGTGCTVAEYVIGPAGLIERLGLGVRLLLGHHGKSRVARWDQLDLSDPRKPRLTCAASDLRDA